MLSDGRTKTIYRRTNRQTESRTDKETDIPTVEHGTDGEAER